MLKAKWEGLDPKQKRWVAVIGGAALFIMAISLFAGEGNTSTQRAKGEDTIRHVLTDRDTRDVSIEGLNAQMQRSQDRTSSLEQELNILRQELGREGRTGIPREVQRDMARMQEKIGVLEKQNSDLLQKSEQWSRIAPSQPVQPGQVGQPDESQGAEDNNGSNLIPETRSGQQDADVLSPTTDPDAELTEEEIFSRTPTMRVPMSAAPGQQNAGQEGEEVPQGLQIISHSATEPAGSAGTDAEETVGFYMPAASILTGVLLNGMDAPTNQGSRRDPFPAALRIQHEAILPNYFSADVEECFLLVSGYGDLSSERAYLRGETISCVRQDGGVMEAKLDGYAVGEDGKAGIRGTLVSKQGAIIARSMLAGFASGAAQAFDVDPVPVIQTDNVGDQQQYQSNYDSSMFQGAAATGTSQALDRVAQFYVEMAESIFPVVEIDAGRQVDVILTSGTDLQFVEASDQRSERG